MDNEKKRFHDMEKIMSAVLIGAAVLFIIFLIAAGCGIAWLKIVTAIITIITCILSLVLLYTTKLLLQPRSMWMTTAAICLMVCLLLSLILGFPSPL